MTSALLTGTLPGAEAVPPDDDRSKVDLIDLKQTDPVPGVDGGALAVLDTSEPEQPEEYEPKATTLPPGVENAAQSVTGLSAGEMVPVEGVPVEIGAPDDATAAEAAALEGDWKVSLLDQAALTARNIEGLAFTVTPPAEATGEAVVAVDYTKFAEIYGADWADRLHFTQFPNCFLNTPDTEGCSEAVEVDTSNIVEARSTDESDDGKLDGERRIEATVDVTTLTDPAPAAGPTTAGADDAGHVGDALYRPTDAESPIVRTAASSGSSVWVAASSGSGSKGDFSATPLPSAGSWSSGGSAGGFTYSYALQPPAVPGGPSPNVTFGYNSQSADGRTSATNNQASWIGDGWEYNPGSITRTYRGCTDDRAEGSNPNNAKRKTGDLCWGSHNAVLSLGGSTTELVKNDKDGTWQTASGDGSRVELVKNTAFDNGDKDGEYWRVTTRDGTQYWFGRHKLPGWSDNGSAADDPVTNSVLTVPVSSNQPGEPCYDATFAESFCEEAWRWNLDYVVDPQGNAMTLWWEKETNHYAKNMKFKPAVSYDRGGYLTRIDYGQRSDKLFGTQPIARVTFKAEERCYIEDGIACSNDNFTSGDWAKTHIWYDTPSDLYCAASTTKECFVPVPTFWSRKRLAQVTSYAQRDAATTDLKKVDSWTLQQSLPAERTDEGTALWLESVTRTGHGTDGEVIKLNPVTFVANAESMPNRVKEGADDPSPTFDRLRIVKVINEYGGETHVEYRKPTGACVTGSGFPAPKNNTGLCFPVYWHPDSDKSDEVLAWFNKYVVTSVQELSAMAGDEPTTTTYEYLDGGAWALNQAEFSKKKTRTYDQWRGFARVRTITGDDAPSSITNPTTQVSVPTYTGTKRQMSETRYFRGMHGDPLPDADGKFTLSRSVEVKDSASAVIADDLLPYAGRTAETLTYDGVGGNLITRSVDVPELTELASRPRDGGIPALKAYRVHNKTSYTSTRSSGTNPDDTRTWRDTRVNYTYEDTYGLPVKVESMGDTGKSGDESCTVSSYVHNTGDHLIGLTKEALTTSGTCSAAVGAPASAWMGGSRVAYDDTAFGAAPTTGLTTATWDISPDGGSWTQSAKLGYDDYGRSTSTVTYVDGVALPASTTTYEPPSGQVYKVTSRNELGHDSWSTLEPGRGTGLTQSDQNDHVTSVEYDALGRTTAGYAANQGTGGDPSVKFRYNTLPGQPVSVVTSTLKDPDLAINTEDPPLDPDTGEPDKSIPNTWDAYSDTVVFYDGLGRERQTQAPAVGDGRLITDVYYGANGSVRRTDNAYFTHGSPSDEIYTSTASDADIPNATLYAYDGLGRTLTETPYLAGDAKPEKSSRYQYGFDYSVSTEPTGAASQRTWSDTLGRTVRVDTFTNAAHTAFRSTRFEFDARGDQTKATDAKGNAWSWTYDARGRQKAATDPDTGTTRTDYDSANRPVITEDARGVKTWTGYDSLSRPTELRLNSASGALITKNTYDTVSGGIGLPATAVRYTDGLPYTTEVTGYTAEYQPTGTKLSLPESVAKTYGLQQSYPYSYDYMASGLLKSTQLPAAGALSAEKVVTRYNEDGLPISTSGKKWYNAETAYSSYGEVVRTTSGEQSHRVWTTNVFDESTGELKQSIVDRESTSDTSTVPGYRVNARSYAYDNAGNITKIEDLSNSSTDRQCYTYDVIGQLRQAWTAGDADCALKADGTPSAVTAGKNGDGYRKTYAYDDLGNRSEMTDHSVELVAGSTVTDSAKDAKTTYKYGKQDGSQPHTLTSMSSSYTTDAGAKVTEASTLTYDAAGNTKTRLFGGDEQALDWTWDGKVEKVTGFGDSGAGPWVGLAGKCIDLSSGSTLADTPVQLQRHQAAVAADRGGLRRGFLDGRPEGPRPLRDAQGRRHGQRNRRCDRRLHGGRGPEVDGGGRRSQAEARGVGQVPGRPRGQ